MQYHTPSLSGFIALLAALALITSVSETAIAQDEVGPLVEEIVSVGTRTKGRTALESMVPVDAFSNEKMEATGQTEVGRMLQMLAPSFNFSSSSISDGTDALRPATLRGLGPDQTLVLVNGKRRHTSALIHVNTSVGRGTAGTDLNAIPASSIKRIEVLRDGASAQYGSDAIAGVINLVLKDYSEGGELSAHYGEFDAGDGENLVFSYNQGLALGSEGFLNFDVEYRDRAATNRAGKSGVCQYLNVADGGNGDCADRGDGVFETTDAREIIFDRQNFRIGDAESEQLSGTLNLDVPLSSSVELYGFATYSQRDNTSGGFYRRAANQARNPTFLFDGVTEVNDGEAYVLDGFLPLINTEIEDYSVNAGLRGELGEWEWDAGVGYAENEFGFVISNSINASLVSAIGSSPTSADAGALELGLTTVDIVFSRPVSWGHVALGAAYREDEYKIKEGELLSYADFDTMDGISLGPSNADAGIQVFSGFSPMNAVDEDRDAISLFVDVEYDAIDRLLLGGALRYEDYSDFGSTVTGKLSGSFQFVDAFMVRGAASTGFRAPSLQQQFFNSTSTQFVSDPGGGGGLIGVQRGTFRNDSQVAMDIGIPTLKEETSVNFSAGFVWLPVDSLSFTVDFYRIQIEDRIVISGAIGKGLDDDLDDALDAANADSAQFFLNAVDTTTKGVDFVADWRTDLWSGDLGVSLAANWTETEIDKIRAPDSLSSVPDIQDKVFTPQDQSILTEWQPKDRVNLTGTYGKNGWNFVLAANRFGTYTVEEGDGSRQEFGAEVLVDSQISYAFESGIRLTLGGNNIFDVTPDKNTIGQSRGGTIVDGNGDVIVDSPGVFAYSRRSAPFGFNGAYWYGEASFNF